ncbi:MAG TPA: hypothetical protein VLF63_01050 [Patescibacteria group bacterium]|nr:hypothetical protein [Patescibacteria group bacterium]
MSTRKHIQTPRIRLVGWNVQPILMVDDGENLTSLQVNPQMIPVGLWQQFKDGGDEKAIEDIRFQISDQSKPETHPTDS